MELNRRDFFKLGAAATCMAAGGNALANEEFDGYPDSYGMLFDSTLCLGSNCRRCEQACKRTNDRDLSNYDPNDNSVFDHTRRTDENNLTVVNRFDNPDDPTKPIYVKKQCMHCQEPACASACLVGAFKKTPEGAVQYNPNICIGCRYCMVACPFSIPAYEYFDPLEPRVQKCTMCLDRIREGKKPACAEICPQETITFGKRSDLLKLAHERIRNHPDRYVDHVFGEHEVGGTSWLYLASTDFANVGFDTTLGTTRYPEYTKGFLGMAPIVLTVFPALLLGFYKASQHRNEIEHKEHSTAEREKE